MTTNRGLLEYKGKKDLFSYYLTKISMRILEFNKTVLVSFSLTGQYSTMVINYYIPSLLLLLICLVTLLIPPTSFNERIMVSLTSLLVLAALFNQAYSATIHTPYLKMFDIWFVALILWCFLVVVFHVWVNHLLVSAPPLTIVTPLFTAEKTIVSEGKAMQRAKGCSQAEKWNRRGTKILSLSFLCFLMLYVAFIFI